MIIKAFYENLPPDYTGFYIDIGAHHPVRYSNTQFFYDHGWNGINIDATPGSMSVFRKMRAKDINLEIAIGNGGKNLTFYCFNEPALNSFDEALSKHRHNTTHFKIINEIPVSTYTLKEILDKHIGEKRKIDFLSIDTEGFDFDVLVSNDWDIYRPDYIITEDDEMVDLTNLEKSKIYRFLKEKNYEITAKTKRNSIYKSTLPFFENPNFTPIQADI
jgi:FkbM family methyltransferase